MPAEPSENSELHSSRWFAPDSLRGFGHRSRLKGMGYDDEDFRGKPVVAILNTWSDLNTCHSHFPERVKEVKRGILQRGGFPVEIPVMSLGEMMMKPTTMLYRNLLAMETEEVLRCHPIDAAVLMGGCDKTVPALLMGAISANRPAIFLPAGPMLRARWKDQTLGSGSDAWKYWDERRAGNLCDESWGQIENCIARSAGTCMTMGTASTMSAIAESLGFTLPGASSVPAVIAEHSRLAVATGRRAVEMALADLRPSSFLSPTSFDNSIVTSMAIGGSTNAIVHIIAMARRAGIELTLERFDELSRTTPVLANIRPAGKFLMEDFFDSGGLPALLKELGEHIDGTRQTVNGQTLAENISAAEVIDADIIRPLDNPISATGGTFVLRGNLAPSGCVIKPTAASPRLLDHTGPAVVFDDYARLKAKLNDPASGITGDSVLILRNAGPQGGPGFPEWGMLPIPDHLLKQGVRDLVRISDARMSGTSYGACVLHIAPEAAVGGPLGLVQTGDLIQLNVAERSLNLLVDDDELARRRAAWKPRPPRYTRGYGAMFLKHVTQADVGCDFDFLHHGDETPDPDIF
ncbi:L-arabinonate dehydratase [Blastopirellula retiformator]|uniref:L-arabonate dehydratase n=1 Tax=Blastopirellula retiformator TaxID=2527970 RepID=A0A5C5V9Z9_9BACT|nr:L-arabinonate dehydratase [Blastopirellula retiformator]TWT34727.1 L-arabonate dehydratase [Blastopirellula retiformator]